MPEPRAINAIPLTIVSDICGSTRGENGENAWIIKASSMFGAVLDLEAETERISTQVCQVNDR